MYEELVRNESELIMVEKQSIKPVKVEKRPVCQLKGIAGEKECSQLPYGSIADRTLGKMQADTVDDSTDTRTHLIADWI